ncbi:MAG: DivIVA domain-containing protein [Eggerthella lenta]
MAITSAEIHNQSFSIDRKGYDVDEVDVFLEHVADEIDGMNAQIAQLENQLDDRKFEGFDTPARVEAPVVVTDDAALAEKDARIADLERQLEAKKADDNAIAQALIIAQRSATRSSRTRMPQAAATIKDAEDEGTRIVDKASRASERCSTPSRSSRTTARTCARTTGTCSPTSSATLRASWPRSAARCPLPCRSAPMRARSTWSRPPLRADVTAPAQAPSTATARARTLCPRRRAPWWRRPRRLLRCEKDLSGFGDADDAFEFEEID